MFLGNTLSAASSGLDSIERQLAVLSQNVSNANTPNYVRETVPLSSFETAAGPDGVRSGQPQRQIDLTLQANLFAAVGTEAGSAIKQTALAGIDQASGSPDSGQDLASLVGNLRDSYSSLSSDPASTTQQLDVLNKAAALTGGINTLSGSLVQARQAAQNALNTDVGTVNNSLASLGKLSAQIVAAQAAGQDTSGLEDQRDGAERTLSQLIGARFVTQSSGDVLVIAANSVIPTRGATAPFSIAPANISAGTPQSALPTLQLNGQLISGLGGEVGANLDLRDNIIPNLQGNLDGFAQGLAAAFQTAGVPLLTDGSGNVPAASAALGFSATIQVSAAVEATPTILRDGSAATVSAGNTAVIAGVLSNVFSGSATGLPAQASTLVATFAGAAAQAQTQATSDTSLRAGLESRLSSVSGVSVDDELAHMVQLQAAYAANAKVVTATQDMWTQLLQAV